MQLLFRSQEELPYDLAMTDKIFNFLPLPVYLKSEDGSVGIVSSDWCSFTDRHPIN